MSKVKAVYQIINLIDNKIYIGSSLDCNRRFVVHRHKLNKNIHDNAHLQRAWNKCGPNAFKFKILQLLSTSDDLLYYEQAWLDWTKAYDDTIGYNIRQKAESNVGHKHTEETKLKISIGNKGKLVTEEAKSKMKANHHLRNKNKWPHELGRKCKCKECAHKNYIDTNKWRIKKKAEGTFKRSKKKCLENLPS